MPPVDTDPPIIHLGENPHWTNASGHLVPLGLVAPEDRLEDQTVRKIMGYATDLSAQIARFRGHTFEDVMTFLDILAEQYGAKRGGRKGNVSLTSYDGCMQVRVQVQDVLTFGPALQTAKAIVDECITLWSDDASDEIRALVQHAFQVDREGKINRAALFNLRRLRIDKEPWPKAMEALSDAIRVVGTREYLRFYQRRSPRDPWEAVSIDIASAGGPA